MTCFYPLTAWRSRDPDDTKNGKTRLVFDKNKGRPGTELKIKCGQCAGCRLDKARSWAVRALHEKTLHDHSYFITLTYSDENLVLSDSLAPTLFPRHPTLFLKRLRKRYGPGIRYLYCGEYGSLFDRPHYHMLLFNCNITDLSVCAKSGTSYIYTSEELHRLWPYGFHSIGDLTFDSACYAARYTLKKITGKLAEEHYGDRYPEFMRVSRRPGLGREFYDKWKSDLYNYDKCVVKDNFIARPPEYYDRLFEQEHGDEFKSIKQARKSRVRERDTEELERLRSVQAEKTKRLSRKYENC